MAQRYLSDPKEKYLVAIVTDSPATSEKMLAMSGKEVKVGSFAHKVFPLVMGSDFEGMISVNPSAPVVGILATKVKPGKLRKLYRVYIGPKVIPIKREGQFNAVIVSKKMDINNMLATMVIAVNASRNEGINKNLIWDLDADKKYPLQVTVPVAKAPNHSTPNTKAQAGPRGQNKQQQETKPRAQPPKPRAEQQPKPARQNGRQTVDGEGRKPRNNPPKKNQAEVPQPMPAKQSKQGKQSDAQAAQSTQPGAADMAVYHFILEGVKKKAFEGSDKYHPEIVKKMVKKRRAELKDKPDKQKELDDWYSNFRRTFLPKN